MTAKLTEAQMRMADRLASLRIYTEHEDLVPLDRETRDELADIIVEYVRATLEPPHEAP